MLPRCQICLEPLIEPGRALAGLCLLCSLRTTVAERNQSRALGAGVIDSA
jgi:hypothetical protein